MSRRVSAVAFAVAIAAASMLVTGVASAGVGSNPNVFPAEDLQCSNGFTSPSLMIIGRTGHVDHGTTGVATKVEVLVPGAGWTTLFEVPGSGLDRLTTHCTWMGLGGAPEFRGEILLRGNLR